MLNKVIPVSECRKHLANPSLTDSDIQEIRDNLYQIATLLIDKYLSEKGSAHGDRKAN